MDESIVVIVFSSLASRQIALVYALDAAVRSASASAALLFHACPCLRCIALHTALCPVQGEKSAHARLRHEEEARREESSIPCCPSNRRRTPCIPCSGCPNYVEDDMCCRYRRNGNAHQPALRRRRCVALRIRQVSNVRQSLPEIRRHERPARAVHHADWLSNWLSNCIFGWSGLTSATGGRDCSLQHILCHVFCALIQHCALPRWSSHVPQKAHLATRNTLLLYSTTN